jgi:hypothetical protein
VNTDENPTVTGSHGIFSNGGGIPTTLLFKNGVVVDRLVGALIDKTALWNRYRPWLTTEVNDDPDVTRTVFIKIDKTAPAGSMQLNGGAATTATLGVTVNSAVSDLNGVAQMRFSSNGKSTWSGWLPYAAASPLTLPSGNGTKTVWAQYADPAGNVYETSDDITLAFESSPPTTTASGADDFWHNVPVTVSLSAVDNAGGTGVRSLTYRIDGGSPTVADGATASVTFAAPQDHSKDGSHTLAFHAVDNAGNLEAPDKTVNVKIDTGAPVTTVSNVPVGWSTTPVTVTLTAGDALSGVAASRYRLQGAAGWTTYAAPFAVTARGTSVYEFSSTDNAGNVEATQTFTVRILPAPVITRLSPASGKRGAVVTISGTGFAAARSGSTVRFGSKASTTYVLWSDAQIKCKVPATARYGSLNVTVTTAAGTSNGKSFAVKR